MKRWLLPITLAMVLLLLCACGTEAKDVSSGISPANAAIGTLDESEASTGDGLLTKEEQEEQNDLASRKLIKTVSVTAETRNYDGFLPELKAAVADNGGYIAQAEEYQNSYNRSQMRNISMQIRIPAEKLEAFRQTLSGACNVIRSSENMSDVTLAYVDTESRIRALKTQEASLIDLMTKAQSLSDLLALQDKLTDVQYKLDTYESQKKTYDDLISYSTVNLTVNEVERETVTEEQGFWKQVGTNLSQTFRDILSGLRAFAIWFLSYWPYLILMLLPPVLVLLIVFGSIRSSRRRRARRAARKAAHSTDADMSN